MIFKNKLIQNQNTLIIFDCYIMLCELCIYIIFFPIKEIYGLVMFNIFDLIKISIIISYFSNPILRHFQ